MSTNRNDDPATDPSREGRDRQWYDLFSRGAHDWLRHNEKIRETVRAKLPELISQADIHAPRGGDATVRVPVRFLEHARFQLSRNADQTGVGQGRVKPGDTLVGPRQRQDGAGKGAGGNEEGGHEFVLELKIDEIVDWLWEELKLPNLKLKTGGLAEDEYVREGWNRHGVRSRLDRRRSVKEAVKRRAIQKNAPKFTDDDLRYRQLVTRRRPATEAVVFFAMDVSSSMTERDRQLAKTFFFWVVQGLRRQYTRLETVFIAHTVEAWEFSEDEFFQVAGSGGTVASTAFDKVLEVIERRFDPARFNAYMFYASDGQNFQHDHDNALAALGKLGPLMSYMGYVELDGFAQGSLSSETLKLFEEVRSESLPCGSFNLGSAESVWDAIRAFFSDQAAPAED